VIAGLVGAVEAVRDKGKTNRTDYTLTINHKLSGMNTSMSTFWIEYIFYMLTINSKNFSIQKYKVGIDFLVALYFTVRALR